MREFYANKYGHLILDTIGEEKPIKDFIGKNIPVEYQLDLETLEKVSLISENENIQIAFRKGTETGFHFGYIVLHSASDKGFLCKIYYLNYFGKNSPAFELERAKRILLI